MTDSPVESDDWQLSLNVVITLSHLRHGDVIVVVLSVFAGTLLLPPQCICFDEVVVVVVVVVVVTCALTGRHSNSSNQ